MRRVQKTILYALTPEEWQEQTSLVDEIMKECQDGIWTAGKITPKERQFFDANYNEYYAKVVYERVS